MNATVIDTLRFANRLKEVGFDPSHAEGMAGALGDELAERMLTRRDLDEFKVVLDARFEAIDARFEGIDARFEAIDSRIDSLDAKFEAKFDALDLKIESVQREVSGKFNVLACMMVLGFTVLGGLVTYTASSPRFSPSPAEASVTQEHAIERADDSVAAPAT
ncbi:MAG: hypothetical protein OXU77_21725 [Gammaproteobacteria bacterium]|nr:hypothetical protein [Gammaproteobacteria bacterium]MDE0442053.1 hypothetical protein [Gammaproteobacteria bacterium]